MNGKVSLKPIYGLKILIFMIGGALEGFLLPPPGGESLKDVADRLKPLVADIQAFPGDVLMVGHQGANMAFKAVLTGCFSAACLDGFRQDNDEIDIWELSPARSVRKIKATVDP